MYRYANMAFVVAAIMSLVRCERISSADEPAEVCRLNAHVQYYEATPTQLANPVALKAYFHDRCVNYDRSDVCIFAIWKPGQAPKNGCAFDAATDADVANRAAIYNYNVHTGFESLLIGNN